MKGSFWEKLDVMANNVSQNWDLLFNWEMCFALLHLSLWTQNTPYTDWWWRNHQKSAQPSTHRKISFITNQIKWARTKLSRESRIWPPLSPGMGAPRNRRKNKLAHAGRWIATLDIKYIINAQNILNKKSNSNSLVEIAEGLHQEPCHLKCYKK